MIGKYNAELLFRVRPPEDAFVELHMDRPYEIHFVKFDTERESKNFMRHEERKRFLHLKEQSIRASILIQGTRL